MSNVYRAPEIDEPREPRVAPPPHDTRAMPNSTLELAAANCNVRLGTGVHYVNKFGTKLNKWEIDRKLRSGEKDDVPEFYRQPFWFVYEMDSNVVVYAEAEMVRTFNDKGKLRVTFNPTEARESLRQLLINWCAARHIDVSLVNFAGNRGFTLKHGRGRR
ncbi:MAG: hypothetical protein GTO63_21480 [Anaerolineae bacterium]|nr:hypothetical protein [Anaerolineae bacterium]